MTQIGDRVKHRINGFQGIVLAKTEYLNGCRQYLVVPEKLDKDGKPQNGEWIDEQHLSVTTAGIFANPFANGQKAIAGGPDRAERAVR